MYIEVYYMFIKGDIQWALDTMTRHYLQN
jgi:hypothetical protein